MCKTLEGDSNANKKKDQLGKRETSGDTIL
jgi:hypothetical protein